ncbi:MAG: hypothetical protein LBG59_01915 [Candidatus Peribacteria bacterium]|jgi:hypothetical protein|nr:hypothetical protein [Candidatus Peribacteria bacterium]
MKKLLVWGAAALIPFTLAGCGTEPTPPEVEPTPVEEVELTPEVLPEVEITPEVEVILEDLPEGEEVISNELPVDGGEIIEVLPEGELTPEVVEGVAE